MRRSRALALTAVWVTLCLACNGNDKDDGTGATGDTSATDTDTDDPGTTSTGAARVATILSLTGDAAAAQGNYTAVCAACHGPDGAGVPPSPALTERVPTLTDDQIVTTILEGKGNMDSYALVLRNQEIADLLAYLKTNFGGAR